MLFTPGLLLDGSTLNFLCFFTVDFRFVVVPAAVMFVEVGCFFDENKFCIAGEDLASMKPNIEFDF